MKPLFIFIGIFVSTFFFGKSAAQVKKYAITKVVIDAGHGGHDSGCKGKFSNEKDVALSISLKVGKLIEENLPEVKVYYTRKTDVFVTLNDRAEIANNLKSDIFICIHCNAGSKVADGTETYVMGLHKTEENLHVAQRENSSILMEDNYQSKYGDFNPNSPEAYIALNLRQNAFLDQSLNIASKVEKNLTSKGREDRGVKQAGFWVLYRTTMPSILVETGFLTNPTEEKFLNSEQGQNEIALGIFNAFKQYKAETDQKNVSKEKVKDPVVDRKKDSIESNIIPVENDTTPKKITFAVQFASATKKSPLDLNKPNYKDLKDIKTEELDGGMLKYSIGESETYEDAQKVQEQMKDKGFRSTFIVAYNHGKRIPMSEARPSIKK